MLQIGLNEISPVGEYTIEDIEYSFYDGGSLNSSSVIIDNYTVDNRKSSVSVKKELKLCLMKSQNLLLFLKRKEFLQNIPYLPLIRDSNWIT